MVYLFGFFLSCFKVALRLDCQNPLTIPFFYEKTSYSKTRKYIKFIYGKTLSYYRNWANPEQHNLTLICEVSQVASNARLIIDLQPII